MAPLVVVGKVAEIRTGRSAGTGEARLQFNDVRISVERRLKGTPPGTLVVEHVATGAGAASSAGPPYKSGERYVLFLQPGEDPRYVVIPQGRYQLVKKSVRPVGPGAVAEYAKGLDEAQFVGEIEALGQRKIR